MKINKVHNSGFTLVEIMIVVDIIGLLAAIAIPNFVKARSASQRNACIANLKQIDGAKGTWAMENKKHNADAVVDTDLFGNTAYIRIKPACPGGGAPYLLNQVDTLPSCTLGPLPDGHTLQ
jgi:prepilin-type N-terminal cleavage/methylation domain-containing protein